MAISDAEIRAVGPEEAVPLAELGARAFIESFPSLDSADAQAHVAAEYSIDAIAAEFRAGGLFFVATIDDERVGYAYLRPEEPHEVVEASRPIELNRIYVLQKWVGTGVGDALMQRSLDAAATGGFDVIWLGTWEQNARAIRFYEKWGFEAVGTKTFTIGSDVQSDLVMSRRV